MRLRYAMICVLVIIHFAGSILTDTADSDDQTVYQAQKKLKDLGYDPGRPDGILGKKTKAAIRHFQRDNGLPVTGKIDEQTKAKLSILKPVSQLSLTEAVKTNDIDKINMLLASGADVNGRDMLGETPLHLAAVRGYKETSTLLVAKGADVNAEDRRGLTPLHAAAWMGHTEIVTMLITEGADISARDKDGVAALHAAALAGRKDTVALLITKGAVINAKNEDGMTPLHAAALSGHKETVALLIARGADVNAENEVGLTPLNVASQKGYLAIVELLRNYKTQE
ncbi:MAG: ankyrin repeat domain-containing protein [Desulfobacterales bacterium]